MKKLFIIVRCIEKERTKTKPEPLNQSTKPKGQKAKTNR